MSKQIIIPVGTPRVWKGTLGALLSFSSLWAAAYVCSLHPSVHWVDFPTCITGFVGVVTGVVLFVVAVFP